MPRDFETQLRAATDSILQSRSPKRLVVAGPGTGKTTTFKLLLEHEHALPDQRLVLTFINNLKTELAGKLGHLSQVMTFHGYCHRLLRQRPSLRDGLSEGFRYFPPLPSLVKTDWELVHDSQAPHLVNLMRKAEASPVTAFYLERSDYYDAIAFDDSVFRVFAKLSSDHAEIEEYDLIVVDEYQDFNRLEAMFIDLLATRSRIVVAGDDDQALYSRLRGSSPQFIRGLHQNPGYDKFELPFCQRCTEVIMHAVYDIVQRAGRVRRLQGRINKTFLHYPPRKAVDSERYPKIKVVETSVQNNQANYFGKYISQEISKISSNEIAESRHEGFPTALVIGPGQYLRQIQSCLERDGYNIEVRESSDSMVIERQQGLAIIKEDAHANLGWRIMLESDQPSFLVDVIRKTYSQRIPLVDGLPAEYRERVMGEAEAWREECQEVSGDAALPQGGTERPTIKLTSFEGSKGLSAQHVFIVGLQEGELPHDASNIDDLEICKLIVALTRTRKQCHLMYTKRWGGVAKRPSVFVSWVLPQRIQLVRVDRTYWDR